MEGAQHVVVGQAHLEGSVDHVQATELGRDGKAEAVGLTRHQHGEGADGMAHTPIADPTARARVTTRAPCPAAVRATAVTRRASSTS